MSQESVPLGRTPQPGDVEALVQRADAVGVEAGLLAQVPDQRVDVVPLRLRDDLVQRRLPPPEQLRLGDLPQQRLRPAEQLEALQADLRVARGAAQERRSERARTQEPVPRG